MGLAFLLLLVSAVLSGQYSSNSLYSLYGIGDLVTSSFALQKSLGGAGVALKSEGFINTLNPASFTEYGNNDVVFDIGVSGYSALYDSRGNTEKAFDSNLDHFGMGFPVNRWWGASFGLMPFSSIGYDIRTTAPFEGSLQEVETDFVGTGGINQFYLANAFRIFKGLSVGVNVSYLMGSLVQTEESHLTSIGFYDVFTENSYYLRNFYVGFGIQFQQVIGEHVLNLGITYNPGQRLSADYSHEITVDYSDVSVTLVSEEESVQHFDIPPELKVGLAWDIHSKICFVGDYSLQQWSGNTSLIDVASFTNASSYRAGLQYIPNASNMHNIFSRMAYRVGAYHDNSYLLLRDNQIKDYGVTMGLGIPLSNQKSRINVSVELGQMGTLNQGLVRERYVGFSLDFVLYNKWFVKQKYD